MKVYLVIADADVYEQRAVRILAVKRTKTAAINMRREHRREVESRIGKPPKHPGNYAGLHDFIRKRIAREAEAESAARAAMPDLPWQLWAAPWRVEEHEVEG